MPEMKSLFATGTRTISSLDHAKIRHDPIQWPNGARVAVVWTIIFELSYTGEDAKKSLYGGRRGVWRLLDQMDRHEVKASFLVNGYAAEKFPEAVVEIKKRGHEIAGYGYITSSYLSDMKPAEEKSEILKTLDILGKVTGSRPTGWVSPDCFPGDRTLEVLAAEGIMWNGDFPNDDLPYVVKAGGKPMVIIPFSTEVDDYQIYGKNLQPPEVWADTFIDSVNVLYKEGATHPKLQHAAMRCHYFGRAVGTKAVDKAIRYGKSLPKVWFATRTEVAQWWLKQHYS
jgi:allantoinase